LNRRSFLAAATALASCSRRQEHARTVLHGAGATLPHPLYARWSARYAELFPEVRINYQPLGSGAGIRQIRDGVVDFGASDEPMTDAQLEEGPRPLLQVPTTIGAVVVAYNLPGVSELTLTPEITADVFLGVVSRWDDERLRAENPSARLPSEPIQVVHRADGSGTSASLTTFLSKRHPAFAEHVGAGKVPRFPVGIGTKGNLGVSALVKSTAGAMGYVEHTHARTAGLAIARMRNGAGISVAPTLDAMTRAAEAAPDLSLVDVDDELAYPITSLSLVMVPSETPNASRGAALARFLSWTVHEGQALAADEGFAPLPPALVRRAEVALAAMRSEGRALLGGG
jgi:phosphate transport system substrate-binding protein